MNNNQENQNPLSTPEEHEKLVLGLKEDTQKALQEAKKWKDAFVKKEQDLAETERKLRQSEEDKEALRTENLKQRRIELDQKETKNKNKFLEHFQTLQTQKGGRA